MSRISIVSLYCVSLCWIVTSQKQQSPILPKSSYTDGTEQNHEKFIHYLTSKYLDGQNIGMQSPNDRSANFKRLLPYDRNSFASINPVDGNYGMDDPQLQSLRSNQILTRKRRYTTDEDYEGRNSQDYGNYDGMRASKKAFLRINPLEFSKKAFLRINPMNQGMSKRAFFRINPINQGLSKKPQLTTGKRAFIRMNPLTAGIRRDLERRVPEYDMDSRFSSQSYDKRAFFKIDPNFKKRTFFKLSPDFQYDLNKEGSDDSHGEVGNLLTAQKRPFFRMNPLSNELKRALLRLQPNVDKKAFFRLNPLGKEGKREEKKAFFRLNPLGSEGKRGEKRAFFRLNPMESGGKRYEDKRAFFRLNPLTQRSLQENGLMLENPPVSPYENGYYDRRKRDLTNENEPNSMTSGAVLSSRDVSNRQFMKDKRSKRSLAFPSYYTYKYLHDGGGLEKKPMFKPQQEGDDYEKQYVTRKSMAAFPFLMRDDWPYHLLMTNADDKQMDKFEGADDRDKRLFLRLNPLQTHVQMND